MNLQSQNVKYFEAFLTYDIYYIKFKIFLAFYDIATNMLYNATALFCFIFFKLDEVNSYASFPRNYH